MGDGRVTGGRGFSEKLLELSAGEVDDGLRLQAHHSAWGTYIIAGEPSAAREHAEAGRRLYDPDQHREHRHLFGSHDPGVCACCFAGQAEWLLGFPDTGLASSSEAVKLAQRIAHPMSLQTALLGQTALYLDLREPELALQQLAANEALVGEQRLGFLHETGFYRGAALLELGAVADAITCLRAALETELGKRQFRPLGLAVLANALMLQGEHGGALASLAEATQVMETTFVYRWEPEIHRLKGMALLRQNRAEESQHALQEAIWIAQRRQMKSFELRAAVSLARLLGEQGRRSEARDLLAPVFGWFTEGFDTADLKEAKALLAELA